jgi:hypothetical protein
MIFLRFDWQFRARPRLFGAARRSLSSRGVSVLGGPRLLATAGRLGVHSPQLLDRSAMIEITIAMVDKAPEQAVDLNG